MSEIKVILEPIYKELTPEYLEERIEELKIIENYLAIEDHNNLIHVFHQLAGSGSSFGIGSITFFGKKIENLLFERDFNQVKKSFDEYRDHLKSIKLVFKED